MTTLKAVNAVENTVKNILTNRENEKAELEALVSQDAAAVAKALEAMEEATAAGDIKAYQKAKAERQDATDAKEMHEARQLALSKKPLITKEDYEKNVAAIYDEIAAIDEETKKKLVTLSEQMEAAALELRDAANKANEVLFHLQHDLYRDADRTHDKSGNIVFVESEEKSVKVYSTIDWGMAGVVKTMYETVSGKKPKAMQPVRRFN